MFHTTWIFYAWFFCHVEIINYVKILLGNFWVLQGLITSPNRIACVAGRCKQSLQKTFGEWLGAMKAKFTSKIAWLFSGERITDYVRLHKMVRVACRQSEVGTNYVLRVPKLLTKNALIFSGFFFSLYLWVQKHPPNFPQKTIPAKNQAKFTDELPQACREKNGTSEGNWRGKKFRLEW